MAVTKSVQNWNIEEVVTFLHNIGITDYDTIFRSNHINGNALSELTHNEMKEDLGIRSLGHRKRILHHLKQYINVTNPNSAVIPARNSNNSNNNNNNSFNMIQNNCNDNNRINKEYGIKAQYAMTACISAAVSSILSQHYSSCNNTVNPYLILKQQHEKRNRKKRINMKNRNGQNDKNRIDSNNLHLMHNYTKNHNGGKDEDGDIEICDDDEDIDLDINGKNRQNIINLSVSMALEAVKYVVSNQDRIMKSINTNYYITSGTNNNYNYNNYLNNKKHIPSSSMFSNISSFQIASNSQKDPIDLTKNDNNTNNEETNNNKEKKSTYRYNGNNKLSCKYLRICAHNYTFIHLLVLKQNEVIKPGVIGMREN